VIKKHGHYYWLDIWIEGKRVRRSPKTTEQGLALEKARDIKNELLAAAQKKDITVHEFSLKYLNWAWDTKPASADQESRRMKKILEFFDSINVTYLSDITPYHIEQLRAWLKTMKVKKGDQVLEKPRSQATLNRYLQLLRGMFYKAIDWEVYKGQNPLKKVKFYRENRVIKPLSHDEAKAVLEACRQIGARKRASNLQKAFADVKQSGWSGRSGCIASVMPRFSSPMMASTVRPCGCASSMKYRLHSSLSVSLLAMMLAVEGA